MKTYITLKIIWSLLIVMGIMFLMLGLYNLDSSLVSIACLFAVASFILKLEIKEYSFNPFA